MSQHTTSLPLNSRKIAGHKVYRNYDFITSILSLYKCFVDPSGELVCRKLQKLFFILLQFDCFLLTSNWLLYLSKASLMVGKKIQFRAMACLVNKSHQ